MALPPLIISLLNPEAFAERPEKVELRQTHISYLLFTPLHVYKIKKPVDFGFLDFTTLEKRLFYCNEEVRLNRRLAPGVYMGVVDIFEKDGRAFAGGAGAAGTEGKPVEYAVKMRRLSEDSILERMMAEGRATEETVRRVARAIATFHGKAGRSEYISGFGLPEAIRKNTGENFEQTRAFIGRTITPALFNRIRSYTEGFIAASEPLFQGRVLGGFIRDCHGDIHSEHVSVSDGIEVIDCIEFNERFRFSDTVSDAAFLTMDIEFHNRGGLARAFEDEYFRASGDEEGRGLLDFYKCYRAYVRGKVEGFKTEEPEVGGEEKGAAALKALHHFYLSGLYAGGGFRPMPLIIRGLSGTGKTTVAEGLCRAFGFELVSSDSVRKGLAGVPPDKRMYAAFREGIYTEDFTERTYRAMAERGVESLKAGRSVIFDATFLKARQIELLKAAIEASGLKAAPLEVVECLSTDERVRENISKRRREATVSDAVWEIYLRQKEVFEEAPSGALKVDTARGLEEAIAGIAWKIFG